MSQLRKASTPAPAAAADLDPVSVTPPAGSNLVTVDLGAIESREAPLPNLCSVLYDSTSNLVSGEPGGGKSFLGCAAAVEAIAQSRDVLVVDIEDTEYTWKRRLNDLGPSDETLTARVIYLRPISSWDDGTLAWFPRLVGALGNPLVIFDSMAELLALDGLDEDSATDVTRWHQRIARPLAHAGATVLVIDHLAKAKERGRWPRGSGAKLAAVDGVALTLETQEPFCRGRSGTSQLVVAKDRHGAVGGVSDVAATVHFAVLDDAVHAVTIRRHDPASHSSPGPQTLHRPSDSSGVS